MNSNILEITISIISGVIALILGIFGNKTIITLSREYLSRKPEESRQTYSDKLSILTNNLIKASTEVDNILKELSLVANDRTKSIEKLDGELSKLEDQEKDLQKRIKDLKDVPIPVAEHFASIVNQGEKRSAIRDYFLFGLGVVVTTIIAIILRLLGLG